MATARRIFWTPAALGTLAEIHAFTERRWGTLSAKAIVAKLRAATRVLREHPHFGRPSRREGVRELVSVHPFVISYRLRELEGDVEILRIWHGAQERDEAPHEDGEVLAG